MQPRSFNWYCVVFSRWCRCQAPPKTLAVAEFARSKPREDGGMGYAPFAINGINGMYQASWLVTIALFALSHCIPCEYTFISDWSWPTCWAKYLDLFGQTVRVKCIFECWMVVDPGRNVSWSLQLSALWEDVLGRKNKVSTHRWVTICNSSNLVDFYMFVTSQTG